MKRHTNNNKIYDAIFHLHCMNDLNWIFFLCDIFSVFVTFADTQKSIFIQLIRNREISGTNFVRIEISSSYTTFIPFELCIFTEKARKIVLSYNEHIIIFFHIVDVDYMVCRVLLINYLFLKTISAVLFEWNAWFVNKSVNKANMIKTTIHQVVWHTY